MKSFIYKHCKNGFYIYAKPNLCDPKTVSKYIGRYLGRPVIATSRIDSYDGDTVTFHYNRHEDNKYVVEKIPALDFISRAISKEAHPFLLNFNKWRSSIISSFGYDPLKCPHCGKTMMLLEILLQSSPRLLARSI